MKEDIIVMTDLKGKFKMTSLMKLTFQVDTLSMVPITLPRQVLRGSSRKMKNLKIEKSKGAAWNERRHHCHDGFERKVQNDNFHKIDFSSRDPQSHPVTPPRLTLRGPSGMTKSQK